MATLTGIGYSQNANWQEASFEACLMARKQLGSTSADMLLLLATGSYCHPETLTVAHSVFNCKNLIGSSTSALILPDRILSHGIAVLAIKSENFLIQTHAHPLPPHTPLRAAGFDFTHGLAQEAQSQRQGYLILGEGFQHQSPDFLQGTSEVAGQNAPLVGGLSGVGRGLKRPCQFYNRQLLENHAVGMMFLGANRCFIDARHPYKVLGKPRVVTKSHETILRTIDGKPAAHIYEDFLKIPMASISQDPLKPHQIYPLGIYEESSNRYLIRNPIDILADGSIVFHADIPQGAQVHLMITNKELCLQSSLAAAKTIKDLAGLRPIELLLILESSARARILGRHALQEIMAIREVLGFSVPLIGLYTEGEVALWPNKDGRKFLALNNNGLILMAAT